MDGPPFEHELASVLSLSLHRLQHTPRAIHRAFLSRPSIFRPAKNIEGLYRAESAGFLSHRGAVEICLGQMIAQARESVLVVGKKGDERTVVVDGRVAWVGNGEVGLVVEGEIARAVSDLFQPRARPPRFKMRSNWPLLTRIDVDGIGVGLSHAGPANEHENERLILSALRSARRFIYAETEALTSPSVVGVLEAMLRKDDGPEVVLMLAKESSGPLRLLQTAMLARLSEADRNDRFRAYARERTGGLLIVDDQFVKIGTSQWTSRSLGDSRSLDLSIEALGRATVVMAIARLRRERIGRALQLEPSEFDARFLLNGSLTQTIESFFTPTRRLEERAAETTPLTRIAFALSPLLDPGAPQALKTWQFALILVTIFALLITFSTLFAPLGM